MDSPFKKGQLVRQVVPVIEGIVTDAAFDFASGTFRYHIETQPADGGERGAYWFDQKDLAAVAEEGTKQ